MSALNRAACVFRQNLQKGPHLAATRASPLMIFAYYSQRCCVRVPRERPGRGPTCCSRVCVTYHDDDNDCAHPRATMPHACSALQEGPHLAATCASPVRSPGCRGFPTWPRHPTVDANHRARVAEPPLTESADPSKAVEVVEEPMRMPAYKRRGGGVVVIKRAHCLGCPARPAR